MPDGLTGIHQVWSFVVLPWWAAGPVPFFFATPLDAVSEKLVFTLVYRPLAPLVHKGIDD